MKLEKIRIKSFQSFLDSGEIDFEAGINLIVGQNNSGKSAIIKALKPIMQNDKHRNQHDWDIRLIPDSTMEIKFKTSIKEIIFSLQEIGTSYLKVDSFPDFDDFLSQQDKNEKNITIEKHPDIYPYCLNNLFGENYSDFISPYFLSIITINGKLTSNGLSQRQTDSWPKIIDNIFKKNTFHFDAERMNVGESSYGFSDRLLPNASNLPTVLHTLNGDKGDKFIRLVEHLREIFPTVGNLSVTTSRSGTNNLEIRVWPTEERKQVELSFPLNQSGTGVSQTIAILTAIMTMENAVIIIDEINSFLHPSAVKALLRIIQTEYSSHQYIISTHAPEVISFSNPSTIHLVKKSGYESKVEKLNIEKVDAFRSVAEHLGVSMSDVFAADKIIWVEGPTEELCFPWLYREVKGKPLPRGTTFLSVMATGDFITKKRDCELTFQIYERLSSAATPLVVSVAFSFDSEELSQTEKNELIKRSNNKMHFLPRRHLECFLLDPDAIAAFINQRDQRDTPITSEEVVQKLTELASERPFHSKIYWTGDITNEDWQSHVDAANLISKACSDLSETRVTFNKKSDSLFLLQHIQKHAPDSLEALKNYVCELVEKN